MRDLFRNFPSQDANQALVTGLLKALTRGVDTLATVQENLAGVEYPFDHVDKGITISKFLIERLPPYDDLAAVDGALSYVANEGLRISLRIVGRLCVIVETVEASLGLPLGEPPKAE